MPQLQDLAGSNTIRNEVPQVSEDRSVQDGTGDARRERLRQLLRAKAKSSLYFLAKGVLGYADLTKRTHLEYCKFIQDLSNKKTLDVMPRGVFKTSIGTIAFSIQYLLNHPNHFVLITNQSSSNAERMILEIEAHLDGSNALMNWLFPEFIKPSKKWKPWSRTQMQLPPSVRTVLSGSPSIQVLGVGSKAESLHFHLVINDDLIGEKAMASTREMMTAISWHDYSVSLFVSPRDGIERMHGTRWSLSDLYSIVLENPEYEYFIRAAKDHVTGELFFPELLDEETLRKLREKNFAVYMSQYMNDPENPEALDFRNHWLRKYELIKTPDGPCCVIDGEKFYVKDMDVKLFVDPAASGDVETNLVQMARRGRARLSNNCVGIWGLHGSGRYFLLDLWAGRARGKNPELQVAERMLKMARAWRGYVRKGYVEAYGAQRALITIFNMLCKDNDFALPMEEIGRGNVKAKVVRIRSYIGPAAQNGMVCIRPHHDQFEYEFSKFPQSDTFDTLDMTAWAFHTLRRPVKPVMAKKYKEQQKRKRNIRLKSIGKAGY